MCSPRRWVTPTLQGKPYGEAGALSGLALDMDGAAVPLDDLAGRRQAEAAPAGSGRVEGIEDPVADLVDHPDARVGHVEGDPPIIPAGREDQLAAGGHGVLGVQDQVQ